MSAPIVRQLILKDLFLFRWMIVASIVAGGASIAIMPWSQVSAYVGGISLICTLIVLDIFLVMSGVVQERKDKVLLFILSLPVSTTQYVVAKVAANAIAFLVPWLVLTVARDRGHRPVRDPERHRALLAGRARLHPLLLLRAARGRAALGFDHSARDYHHRRQRLAQLRHSLSARASLGFRRIAKGPTAVWTGDIVAIVAAEILIGALVLGVAVYLRPRTWDFV